MRATSSISVAVASRRGSAVSSPVGVGEQHEQVGAPTRLATSAASRSLSPKRISSSATASFSLTTGTTPSASSGGQRVARVQVLPAVREVGGREQHLADGQAHRGEGVAPAPT